MSDSANSFQQLFMERLAGRFKTRSELVHEVSRLLHVGRDAVYRRLRGDTALTADELMLLARAYNIHVEIRTGETEDQITLRYPEGRQSTQDEYDFFQQLQLQLREMERLPQASMDVASPDLPIYYLLSTPMLRSFKVFMYGITSWNLDKWKNKKFTPDLIGDDLHELIEQTVAESFNFPARELWSFGILDSTLRQIRFMVETERFERIEDVRLLFSELIAIIDHLEKMVSTGRRFLVGGQAADESPALSVYHHEFSTTSNVVLIRSERRSFLYSTVLFPNYASTTDPMLTDEVEKWFDNSVHQGRLLQDTDGDHSVGYFAHLRQRVRDESELLNAGA